MAKPRGWACWHVVLTTANRLAAQTQGATQQAGNAAGGAWMGSWQLLRAWLGLLALPAAAPPPRTLAQAVRGIRLDERRASESNLSAGSGTPVGIAAAASAAAASGGAGIGGASAMGESAAGWAHPRDFPEEDPEAECALARGALAAAAAALDRRQVRCATWRPLAALVSCTERHLVVRRGMRIARPLLSSLWKPLCCRRGWCWRCWRTTAALGETLVKLMRNTLFH